MKSALPVLSRILITRNSDGLVKLQGTDLDALAAFTLNNTVLVPFEH